MLILEKVKYMKVDELLKTRQNRNLRGYKCIDNFIKMSAPCLEMAEKLSQKNYEYATDFLIERSIIITYVSAVEVFYKDYLNLILHICKKDFVQKTLKELHQNKYDINDLIQIYKHEINPYELVSSSISFQNIESIDKVFSKFLNKKGLWSSLDGMKIRFNKDDKKQAHFQPEYINSLKNIFQLRHELVHDPAKTNFINENIIKDLDNSIFCIIFSNIILNNIINDNFETNRDSLNHINLA